MKTTMDLSIHVRRMKFMQRGQSAETNQALEETSAKVISDEQWELDVAPLMGKPSKYEMINSHADICDLRYGRMSFQGFNKQTERMMKIWNNEEEEQPEEKSDDGDSIGSISDEEMAERYTTLVGTVAKKFRRKRQKSEQEKRDQVKAKKKKTGPGNFFLKPDEDG